MMNVFLITNRSRQSLLSFTFARHNSLSDEIALTWIELEWFCATIHPTDSDRSDLV